MTVPGAGVSGVAMAPSLGDHLRNDDENNDDLLGTVYMDGLASKTHQHAPH